MAAGAMVVGGVVTIVAVGTAMAVTYGFSLYDQKQENVRRTCMLNKLRDDQNFLDAVCERAYPRYNL